MSEENQSNSKNVEPSSSLDNISYALYAIEARYGIELRKTKKQVIGYSMAFLSVLTVSSAYFNQESLVIMSPVLGILIFGLGLLLYVKEARIAVELEGNL